MKRFKPQWKFSPGWALIIVIVSVFMGCVAKGKEDNEAGETAEVTNVAALLSHAEKERGFIGRYSLSGTVLGSSHRSSMIFFQDESGTVILETDLTGQSLLPGQKIRLEGTNYVIPTSIGISLGKSPLVENDGEHSFTTSGAGTVYLEAGFYPIQVCWFNHKWEYALSVQYSGPGFGLTNIPDSVLFHQNTNQNACANGLNYRCYDGEWDELPDFQNLHAVKFGIARNFDTKLKTRNENTGMVFDGMIRIEAAGVYTFRLQSDDGSRLFLGRGANHLTLIGMGKPPEPTQINSRQPLAGDRNPLWAVTSGRVTFLAAQKDGIEMELTAQDSFMHVKICSDLNEIPDYLMGCQIRVRGVCINTSSLGGYRIADALVVPGWEDVQVWEVPSATWTAGKPQQIEDCQRGEPNKCVVRLRGVIANSQPGGDPVLRDATGRLPLQLLNSPSVISTNEVDCMGIWDSTSGPRILKKVIWRRVPEASRATNDLPLLTTAAQVQQLKTAEARRGYPVRIRGVVTWVSENRDCIVLQDSTRGVFVGLHPNWIWDAPIVGEKMEINGKVAAGEFTPFVFLNDVKRLGMGLLPSPIYPTWDQLIGGSMDSQYVEIRGLVTTIHGNQMGLLLPGGETTLEFRPAKVLPSSYLNSVVRIRGVTFAKWDPSNYQVIPANPVWFDDAAICVEVPPVSDSFEAEKMQTSQLMQYDVQRDTFQRVKVSAQYLGAHGGTFFLTDNGFGLRAALTQPAHFEPGDIIEVAGLVELGGPSPKLRQAVARKTGHKPLPAPVELVFTSTNNAGKDSSLVWTEGILTGRQLSDGEEALEIQIGLKHFITRVPVLHGRGGLWPIGSRLKLTGVFSDQGNDRAANQEASSFELLLNSPSDVELLARPSWWTLDRLLIMLGVLTAVLALAFFWISQLRREVDRRSVQLKKEIHERQRAEQERAIERERSRIALDLHDDLGSRLTAISMLAVANQGRKLTLEASRDRLDLIAEKARTTVTTLDGLVWTVDPKNDTITALAEYLASFAEEFLSKTKIHCDLDFPVELPDRIISAEVRHNVLLAIRETLNNAVRHGQPAEVRLKMKFSETQMDITIHDDGCGFSPAGVIPGNGLFNLRQRMSSIGGQCRIESSPGNGTTVLLSIPFDRAPDAAFS